MSDSATPDSGAGSEPVRIAAGPPKQPAATPRPPSFSQHKARAA